MSKERNIFEEALALINNKKGKHLKNKERRTISTAMLPLMILPEYSNTPICEGLEELSRMIEEAR